MVGGHEQQAPLGGGNAVQCVELAGHGDSPTRSSPCWSCGIHVLEDQGGIGRDRRQDMAQSAIVELRRGEIEKGQIQPQLAGQGADQAGLAGAGRALEQIASPPGDTALRVPFAPIKESPGVPQRRGAIACSGSFAPDAVVPRGRTGFRQRTLI